MYFLWMLLLLYVDFSTENECSTVQRFNQSVVAYQLSLVHEHENKNAFCHTLQVGVITAVNRFSYSISYAGLDSIHDNQTAQYSSCSFKIANMINKFGTTLSATLDSTQSAVRNKASALIYNSTCPGFGMCADLSDGDEQDVWPIVAITVSSYFSKPFEQR